MMIMTIVIMTTCAEPQCNSTVIPISRLLFPKSQRASSMRTQAYPPGQKRLVRSAKLTSCAIQVAANERTAVRANEGSSATTYYFLISIDNTLQTKMGAIPNF